jgi:thiamine-phosphate pyrophosphorylase
VSPSPPSSPTGPGVDPRLGRLHVLVDSLIVAEAALEAGAQTLQVRIKTGTDADRYRLARHIVDRCRAAGATCMVNDRADLAVALGADGVHVGADDLPVPVVRGIVGPAALVGGTARDPETAQRLVRDGADYLGVGPTYATTSKSGLPAPIGVEGVQAVVEAVDVPVVAISGITVDTVDEVLATGAWGIAVIGAIADSPDPHTATHDLLMAVTKAVESRGGSLGGGPA